MTEDRTIAIHFPSIDSAVAAVAGIAADRRWNNGTVRALARRNNVVHVAAPPGDLSDYLASLRRRGLIPDAVHARAVADLADLRDDTAAAS